MGPNLVLTFMAHWLRVCQMWLRKWRVSTDILMVMQKALMALFLLQGPLAWVFLRKTRKSLFVRQPLIHPQSPYRQCLDLVIRLADEGKTATEVFNAVEDRWHIEYPATNNAVPNGGIVAASLWFGEGDFLKTINLAFGAADFTDADCNAANAAAVIGAMKGLKGIPDHLVKSFGDRIRIR